MPRSDFVFLITGEPYCLPSAGCFLGEPVLVRESLSSQHLYICIPSYGHRGLEIVSSCLLSYICMCVHAFWGCVQ